MKWLKHIFLAAAGLALLSIAWRNLPLHDLGRQLYTANYWLIIPVFAVTLFGYFVRIQRWQILYKNLNQKVSTRSAWISLSAGYLVSYAIPRGGEVTRCLLVKRYNNVPFSQSLATVIMERLMDIVVLFLLVLSISVLNVQQMTTFFQANIFYPLVQTITLTKVIVLGVIGVVLLAFMIKYINTKKQDKNWVDEFLSTCKQLVFLQGKWAFLAYTLLLWFSYFMMTFLWVFAFAESAQMPIAQVFVIMVIGTIGKSVPIQGGGMGAYHYLVAQAFLLFGVGALTGNALAIIIHGAQTVYTILTGSIAYGVLLYDEKNRNL